MSIAYVTILEKASDLYQHYGIRSTTMDDVAEKLGISKKTLYQQVPSKEALLQAVLDLDLNEKKKELENTRQNSEADPSKFVSLIQTIFKFVGNKSLPVLFDLRKYYPEMYRDYYQKFTNIVSAYLQENIQHGKTMGKYRIQINEERFSRILLSSIMNMNDYEMIPRQEFGSEEFREDCTRHFLYSLMNNPDSEQIEELIKKTNTKTI